MMNTSTMDVGALGRTGRFDELLEFLRLADYNDEFLRRRFCLERAEDFEVDRKKRAPLPIPESNADILTALFLAGEAIELNTVRHFFSAGEIELLEGMGLLRCESETDRCYATVALYPVGDLYMASDRWSNYDGSQFSGFDDMVYSSFTPNTRLFLRHLPERPGGRFLDLCGGSGIAALLAARRGSEQAWSGDISDRSTGFAEFNRQLNAISNVHAVTSDLYQNFHNCRFDVISAHPPYVPTLQPRWIFFSGGRDGEEITRRIVEGLPDHLNDCGIFIALTMGTDRADRPFERRIREWLGTREKDFDIAFLAHDEENPREFASRMIRGSNRAREEFDLWIELFKSLEVKSLAYGFIFIQKRSGSHRTFTLRRQASPSALRSPWEWLLNWESAACSDSLEQLVLNSPMYAAHQTEFVALHHLEQGFWNPSSYKLQTEYPFNVECSAQPWMAHLISLCDGKSTGRDMLRTLIENEALPKATPAGEFARAVASLVSGGFVEIEGFRPPRAAK
jgi:SAM-dependent methyltransferase